METSGEAIRKLEDTETEKHVVAALDLQHHPDSGKAKKLEDMSKEEVVAALDLEHHPEGGFYKQTWKSDVKLSDSRSSNTAIFFLLGTVGTWTPPIR
jgi:hypothetical protein